MLAKFDSNFKRTRSSLQAGCVASTNCKRRDQGTGQCVVAVVQAGTANSVRLSFQKNFYSIRHNESSNTYMEH